LGLSIAIKRHFFSRLGLSIAIKGSLRYRKHALKTARTHNAHRALVKMANAPVPGDTGYASFIDYRNAEAPPAATRLGAALPPRQAIENIEAPEPLENLESLEPLENLEPLNNLSKRKRAGSL